MSKELLAAALWYAKNQWHIFPVAPGKKTPITLRGFLDATTDEHTIRAWWAKYPNANIGIATEASGLVVVDIDTKNAGDATYEALRADLDAQIFDTVTALTPSGGQHLVYATDGTQVKSGAHVLGQGIDIRAAGGYIVAAPSVVGQNAYAWEVDYSPRDRQPAIWPDALAERVVTRSFAAPLEENGKIPSGERNATIASIAGSLRRRGLDFDEILGALMVVNAKRCEPKVPQYELERTVQSICRYAPSEVIGITVEPVQHDDVRGAADIFSEIHDVFDESAMAIPFGVKLLDEKLGGMYPQQMTVLAARTGVGKTAAMEHIVEGAAKRVRVLVFSLEMGQRRLIERIAARRMGMQVRAYREAGRPMDDPAWFDHFDLHIVGKTNKMSIEQIGEHVDRVRPHITVIDHARHIRGWLARDGKMRADLSPAFIMHELGEIAERCCTHVLLLSQVNRNADGARPSLSDLRDSGSVEENADNVVFLHRPFQFGDDDPPMTLERDSNGDIVFDDVMEWFVAKSREAGSFVAHTGWRGEIMQVYDYPSGFGVDDRYKRCCLRKKKGSRAA